jgi:hypothetical protein
MYFYAYLIFKARVEMQRYEKSGNEYLNVSQMIAIQIKYASFINILFSKKCNLVCRLIAIMFSYFNSDCLLMID